MYFYLKCTERKNNFQPDPAVCPKFNTVDESLRRNIVNSKTAISIKGDVDQIHLVDLMGSKRGKLITVLCKESFFLTFICSGKTSFASTPSRSAIGGLMYSKNGTLKYLICCHRCIPLQSRSR